MILPGVTEKLVTALAQNNTHDMSTNNIQVQSSSEKLMSYAITSVWLTQFTRFRVTISLKVNGSERCLPSSIP